MKRYKSKYSDEQIQKALALYDRGEKTLYIEAVCGLPDRYLRTIAKRYGRPGRAKNATRAERDAARQ